jgi:2-polyprenyl-3-methyl-5-hydroxy-6-metoxy-1,4-benzoquinol methylase
MGNSTRPAGFLYDHLRIHATVVQASRLNDVKRLLSWQNVVTIDDHEIIADSMCQNRSLRSRMRASALVKRYLTAIHRKLMGGVMFEPDSAGARPHILNSYVRSAPTAQNALDIFDGEWASSLPSPYSDLRAGRIPLFADARISRLLAEIGGVTGKTVLELGPLEGGHSYMLDRAGPTQVVSIEGNSRAFLKCLIVKELLGLPRVQFLCGDFMAYLHDTERSFDVCVASGVLYHMQNPAELLALLAKHCTGDLFLWTHYFDLAPIEAHSKTGHKFSGSREHTYLGFQHTLHVQEYQRALDRQSFCGGNAPTSSWMSKADILRGLEYFGFTNIRILGDQPDHPNGPAFEVVAKRGVGVNHSIPSGTG